MTVLAPEKVPAKGMAKDLAQAAQRLPAQAGLEAMVIDGRRQTLQQVAAPIAYLDVVYPFPSQLHPVTTTPGIGDPGAYSTAAQLEDR